MPSSDEDFESADEGQSNVDRKERKKRNSSSNYSDNLESDPEFKTPIKMAIKTPIIQETTINKPVANKEADGWDDFDVEDTEPVAEEATMKEAQPAIKKESKKSQDTGWDDFDDWGDDGISQKQQQQKLVKPTQSTQPTQPIPPTEQSQPAQPIPQASGWGWGWSVDSLLSTASAGITNITSQVSQGISTVLETGIGAPDPEELARSSRSNQVKKEQSVELEEKVEGGNVAASGDAFQLGSLLSGVTKFVESTGTKVLAGGLDTLETIGKKTMEVLQDGDPGLAKKRAMLGLDSGDKPILSQVLREAKAKADEEDKIREDKREAKEIHYETLFDDFEGLVHLEALEMLSRQTSMRIEERLRAADPDKRQDVKETLQQVAELCEMQDEADDDDDESTGGDKAEAFHERLQSATQDLGLKLQFQPLIKWDNDLRKTLSRCWMRKAEEIALRRSLGEAYVQQWTIYRQYTEILEWLDKSTELTDKALYKRCVSALAQATALSMLTYHKTGELLLTKQRRSTADEADALTQMTVVLKKHISELATLFTEKLNSLPAENKDQINNYITYIFLEAGNSSTYVQNAFQLALPILQIGAV